MNEPADGGQGPGVYLLLEKFDTEWATTRREFRSPPDLAPFLPSELAAPAREALLAQLVKKDLRQRIAYRSLLINLDKIPATQGWQAGLDPWLTRYPELRSNSQALRMLVIEEFEARRIFEPDLKADEIQHRFPEIWDEELANALAALQAPSRSYVIFPWKLGEGAFGEVYWAYNRMLKRWEAAKKIKAVYRGYRGFGKRLIQEARIAGRLDHPGIAPVHALVKDEFGRPYYVMRYVAGESLENRIDKLFKDAFGPPDSDGFLLEQRALLRYFVDVCRTVMYAHHRRIVHRDLKPANILIQDDAPVVMDWGLAKERFAAIGDAFSLGMSSDPAQSQGIVGTLYYMSPELAAMAKTIAAQHDRVQPSSDVYSLGATLYHILTGRPAFQGIDSEQVRKQVVVGNFPKPRQTFSRIPRSLEAICLKAMHADPNQRYDNAEALAKDIERDLAGLPTDAYPEPWLARAQRWARKHKIAIGVTTLIVTLTSVGLGVANAMVKSAATSTRTQTLASQLESIPFEETPAIVRELAADPERARALLEQAWAQTRDRSAADPRRSRIAFALEMLRGDEQLAAELAQIAMSSPLSDALALRESSAIASETAVSCYWSVLENSRENASARFNAGCLLAHARGGRGYQTSEFTKRWSRQAEFLVDQALVLASEDPEAFSDLEAGLRPLGATLGDQLARKLVNSRESDHRRMFAARLLEQYRGSSTDLIAECLLEEIPGDARSKFESLLARSPRMGTERLKQELKKTQTATNIDPFEQLSRRQAIAALLLARLEGPENVWPLLKMTKFPSVRYEIMENARNRGLLLPQIADRLAQEQDASIRQALTLMLGHWTWEELNDQQQGLETRLQEQFRQDRDPGVHSATEWLLKRWGRTVRLEPSEPPLLQQGQGWYVTPSEQTMIVIANPELFRRGSANGEGGPWHETRQRAQIHRTFAVSALEVTCGLYKQFLKECPHIDADKELPRFNNLNLKDEDPALGVDWFHAALFCRWLSEKHGFSDADCPYPPGAEIRNNGQGAVTLRDGYLDRPGYRLPTEMEWECVCRAGTESSRFFGWSDRSMHSYASYPNPENTQADAVPSGSLKPNPWGFFDVLGNACEWTQDPFLPYETIWKPWAAAEDKPFSANIKLSESRGVRGGSYASPPRQLRGGARQMAPPTTSHREMGFRVARTLTHPKSAEAAD